jgi:hypothetical protein
VAEFTELTARSHVTTLYRKCLNCFSNTSCFDKKPSSGPGNILQLGGLASQIRLRWKSPIQIQLHTQLSLGFSCYSADGEEDRAMPGLLYRAHLREGRLGEELVHSVMTLIGCTVSSTSPLRKGIKNSTKTGCGCTHFST